MIAGSGNSCSQRSLIPTPHVQMLSKYTKEVLVVETKAAKREPEFTFYDAAETKLYAYNVKPAVFDLFLAFAVFMYLGLVYLSVKVRS